MPVCAHQIQHQAPGYTGWTACPLLEQKWIKEKRIDFCSLAECKELANTSQGKQTMGIENPLANYIGLSTKHWQNTVQGEP